MQKIGFGGGCHWCTEAIFQSLIGVTEVQQGWIASTPPYDSFSEAVLLEYSHLIPLEVLIEVHLRTHSSKKLHGMSEKYRSAIYYDAPKDKAIITAIIQQLATQNNCEYVTQVLPMVGFKLNQEQYLNYYKKDPEKPFCKTYIDPKLKLIREHFGNKRVKDAL